jgi:hypothetical protein
MSALRLRNINKTFGSTPVVAHDTILERDVALKVMVAQIADDPELNQRFGLGLTDAFCM